MAATNDPEELKRFTRDIPLPAYLASRGYASMPDPEYSKALLLVSPNKREALSVSKRGDVWLYTDRNNPQNKGTIINWAQHHGAANLGKVRAGLRPFINDEKRVSELAGMQNLLEQNADIARREAGRAELEEFVRDIPLPAFLEKHGYEFDAKESGRNSLKFRGEAGVLLVSQQSTGAWVYWNASNEQDKGTITQFCHNNLGAANLGEVRKMLRPELSGEINWTPPETVLARPGRGAEARDVSQGWGKLDSIYVPNSDTARYYLNDRGINSAIGKFEDSVKVEHIKGWSNVAMAHYQYKEGAADLTITGWEKKGPGNGDKSFSGFSGHRGLAIFGKPEGDYSLKICESGVDALSRAELDIAFDESEFENSVYISTGGAVGDAAAQTLSELLTRHPPADIAIGMDSDEPGRKGVRPGRVLTERVLEVVREAGSKAPVYIEQPRDKKDWNAQLQFLRESGELHASDLSQGRPDQVRLPIEPGQAVDWDAIQKAQDEPWPPGAAVGRELSYTVHQAPGVLIHQGTSLEAAAKAWSEAPGEAFPILHRNGPLDVDASGDARPTRLGWVIPGDRQRTIDKDAVHNLKDMRTLAEAQRAGAYQDSKRLEVDHYQVYEKEIDEKHRFPSLDQAIEKAEELGITQLHEVRTNGTDSRIEQNALGWVRDDDVVMAERAFEQERTPAQETAAGYAGFEHDSDEHGMER